MSEPTSHICPECFTPRASDGTPSCACGRRASEALLETRTAEAAAAEDFDPLRIRPYVELGDENDARPDQAPTIAMPMTTAKNATTGTTPTTPNTSAIRRSFLSGPTTQAAPTPPFPSAAATAAPSPGRPRGRRRRRTGLMVALAGTAAAGVMAAAGFASGLFSYEAPVRDRALPDDLRASVPDTSPDGEASPVEPSGEGGGGGGAPAPAPSSGGGGGSPSPTKDPSPSPSPSEPSGSPSPSGSPTPERSAPSAGASTGSSAAGANEADDSRIVAPKTLRVGDDDPEVTELQLRLRQLGIYTGDIDESFDEQVEQAVLVYQNTRGITKDREEPGVYGLVTRQRLESETKEP